MISSPSPRGGQSEFLVGVHVPDAGNNRSPGWRALAIRRRLLLGVAVLVPAIVAGEAFAETLPWTTPPVLASSLVLLFAIMFAWLSWGAWTAIAGFLVLRRHQRPRSTIHVSTVGSADPGRTAIVLPICDEETTRVFAGLEAIYRSLAETGRLDAFDFYVLSDSRNPEVWIEEETALGHLRKRFAGFDRLYYRRRAAPTGGKAANIADFCRRWGCRYRYMLVLDADSIMTGTTVVRLAELMDAHPTVGMIQTLPMPVNRVSLFARAQQFAARLYGPLCAAGLHYWQLGEGIYWGHNAILRMEPFMEFCGLPRLPGKPPLGGDIMSHDFVEAALMGRAGWTIWLAYDLEGSYEEVPPTLPDLLRRDRRWCQGNLQHTRLLSLPGVSLGHRIHFLLGILSYVIAPLWMVFLLAETMVTTTAQATSDVAGMVTGAPPTAQGMFLLTATLTLLLVPRALGLVMILTGGDKARSFGGTVKCVVSALLETVFFALIAPILMVYQSWFVMSILAGRQILWCSQLRQDHVLTWSDAARNLGGVTALGVAWGAAAIHMHPDAIAAWLVPVLASLILAIPVAVHSSSVAVGERLKHWGLFLTPEETRPPKVLRELQRALEQGKPDDADSPPTLAPP